MKSTLKRKRHLINRQGRTKIFLKKLIGRIDMEDSLTRLDRLPQEEARMAAAQVRKVASTVNDKVRGIADNHA